VCVCARKTGAKMVSICALSAQNFLRLRRAYQASGGACGEPKNRDFTRHWITRTADPADPLPVPGSLTGEYEVMVTETRYCFAVARATGRLP
jgi:hypothetical protein